MHRHVTGRLLGARGRRASEWRQARVPAKVPVHAGRGRVGAEPVLPTDSRHLRAPRVHPPVPGPREGGRREVRHFRFRGVAAAAGAERRCLGRNGGRADSRAARHPARAVRPGSAPARALLAHEHLRARSQYLSVLRSTQDACRAKSGPRDPALAGGRTTWENVVCSCVECNRRKGGRTPRQARMRLFRAPSRPRWTPIVGMVPPGQTHPEWGPFLSILDAPDRNTELAEH